MSELIPIRTALVSVYHKQGLEPLVSYLAGRGVLFYSTGGSADYLRSLGAQVAEVADLTGYPSILGGRVKTLHPKVHGGILARREEASDREELIQYEIPEIDLVIVDLYPFEATVASGAPEEEIVEKIDIGGIALIRGAAKNFRHVLCLPSQAHYGELLPLLETQEGATTLDQRRRFAAAAFDVSSHYDTQVQQYFAPNAESLKVSAHSPRLLRYGENPHQRGWFYGHLEERLEQLGGKELSFNNLVDVEAAVGLADEVEGTFVAIIKHTNPCGCALGESVAQAWKRALEADPLSAFGGVIACNGVVDEEAAAEMDQIFFEVLAADDFTSGALDILAKKKQRILLRRRQRVRDGHQVRNLLGGWLVQDSDLRVLTFPDLEFKTSRQPSEAELADVFFADLVCKHMKSNAIALVKGGQLIGSGVGQTSRIDALRQAIAKAQEKGFELAGAVLASDAFFPFADSVEAAWAAGIRVVVEPGGSVRDADSINFCETHHMSLIFTGLRHFRH